jgi:DNA polymerase
MLVGESPSATDDRTGLPFTGPAGKVLDQLLDEAGVHRRNLWITNLVRCFDGAVRNGRIENRPATALEIRACRTWTDIEIRYVNPRVILAVGAPAAKHIIGPGFRLLEQHGQIFQRPDERLAVAMAQPAWIMRLKTIDPDRYDAARADLLADIRIAAQAAGLVTSR